MSAASYSDGWRKRVIQAFVIERVLIGEKLLEVEALFAEGREPTDAHSRAINLSLGKMAALLWTLREAEEDRERFSCLLDTLGCGADDPEVAALSTMDAAVERWGHRAGELAAVAADIRDADGARESDNSTAPIETDLETKVSFYEMLSLLSLCDDLRRGKLDPGADIAEQLAALRAACRGVLMPADEMDDDCAELHRGVLDQVEEKWEALLIAGRSLRERLRAEPGLVPAAFMRRLHPEPEPFFAELALAALAASEREG